MKRQNKVKIEWSPNFSYAIGLLAADGNLSPDKRHINITSKDKQIITNLKECLGLKNRVGKKSRGGYDIEKRYYVLQFGDVNFYNFLLNLGLMPNKSLNLKKLKIPDNFFADFLRGYFDGDGSIGTHKHPESRQLQLRVRFAGASMPFLLWLKKKISDRTDVGGGWFMKSQGAYQLSYGKRDSFVLLKFMYDNGGCSLERKYLRARTFLE